MMALAATTVAVESTTEAATTAVPADTMRTPVPPVTTTLTESLQDGRRLAEKRRRRCGRRYN
jgi:hypothetical protein